ncbi:MAG: hypothetical protein HQ502_09210 [Alphaproteobacteria bacterium]|nr:hypothetical protein [Alphaproteobacteria bacterium]
MLQAQKELGRLGRALAKPQSKKDRQNLYVAQQALAWAGEPNAFRAPFDMIANNPTMPVKDIPVDLGDC